MLSNSDRIIVRQRMLKFVLPCGKLFEIRLDEVRDLSEAELVELDGLLEELNRAGEDWVSGKVNRLRQVEEDSLPPPLAERPESR